MLQSQLRETVPDTVLLRLNRCSDPEPVLGQVKRVKNWTYPLFASPEDKLACREANRLHTTRLLDREGVVLTRMKDFAPAG